MEETDVAYVAGFMDAEGCICIVKAKTRYFLKVVVANTNSGALRRVQEVMNRNVSMYKDNRKRHSQLFYLAVYGKSAKSFLERIMPYLRVKKTQALLAVDFQSKVQNKPKLPIYVQDNYREQVSLLKHRPYSVNDKKFGIYVEPAKDIDFPYISGFFDGEGCIRISNRKGVYRFKVNIINTNLDVLKKIQEIAGGSLYKYPIYNTNYLQVFSLDLYCNIAKRFLEGIRPYLIIKREQAQLALEFQDRKRNGLLTIPKDEQESYRFRINSFNSGKGKRKS